MDWSNKNNILERSGILDYWKEQGALKIDKLVDKKVLDFPLYNTQRRQTDGELDFSFRLPEEHIKLNGVYLNQDVPIWANGLALWGG